MQITPDFGYDQVFELVRQLSPEELERLTRELKKRRVVPMEKQKLSKEEYAKMLLDCPVMTDEEFESFEKTRKELRDDFNRRLGFFGAD